MYISFAALQRCDRCQKVPFGCVIGLILCFYCDILATLTEIKLSYFWFALLLIHFTFGFVKIYFLGQGFTFDSVSPSRHDRTEFLISAFFRVKLRTARRCKSWEDLSPPPLKKNTVGHVQIYEKTLCLKTQSFFI